MLNFCCIDAIGGFTGGWVAETFDEHQYLQVLRDLEQNTPLLVHASFYMWHTSYDLQVIVTCEHLKSLLKYKCACVCVTG